jgi:flagellar basal-body rod protein FlgB
LSIETVSKGIRVKPWLKQIEGEAPVFQNLEIFRMAFGLAVQAASRQSVIAQNIANADTPGYRAMDIPSFESTYQSGDAAPSLRVTRPGHMAAADAQDNSFVPFETNDPLSPNGNSVSLENEMVKASEVRQQHQLALSVYSTSLNILRASLGRN